MDDGLSEVDYGEDGLMSPYVIFYTPKELFDIWQSMRAFKEDDEGLLQVSGSIAIVACDKHSPFPPPPKIVNGRVMVRSPYSLPAKDRFQMISSTHTNILKDVTWKGMKTRSAHVD